MPKAVYRKPPKSSPLCPRTADVSGEVDLEVDDVGSDPSVGGLVVVLTL